MTTVAVVGSKGPQLLPLLTAAGMTARLIDTGALSSFGRADAPDVLMIDARGGTGIPKELAAIKRLSTGMGVVIIVDTLEPSLLLEAMRAGVNELVAEPITQQELERAVGRVLGQRTPTEAGKIIGFVGAKGGVGTTTVAVNVATALSRLDRGSRTLLVDMHQAAGDASVFTGVEPKFSVLNAVENTHRLDRSYFSGLVVEIVAGLDLLASSDRPFPGQTDPARIRTVLDFVRTLYRHVVLDLPRSDAPVLDALDQTSVIYIVANQELATVKSGARLAATLRQRYGRERVKVLLSRSDRQADIGFADVERVIGTDIAYTFPSDYRLAVQALNRGRPLVLDGDSELAESFRNFAEQLSGGKRREPAPARGGLLGRLKQLA